MASPLSVPFLTVGEFRDYLATLEPADCLLIVNPGVWPAAGYDFDSIVQHSHEYRGAVHAISIGGNPGAFREHIDCDDEGRIRRVQRLYTVMNWPETGDSAILCSLVPAGAIQDVGLDSLSTLRNALAGAGLFTQDIPVASDVFDLRSHEGVLAVNDVITQADAAEAPPRGWSRRAKGVLVGANCQIHPSCRFVPPVVIHPGVHIHSGVSIIGPSVVGANCLIHHDAFISHVVLAAGTTVSGGAVVTRQVGGGRLLAGNGRKAGSARSTPSAQTEVEDGGRQAFSRLHGRKRMQFAVKRLLDVLVSGVALVLLAPLFLVVAVLIKRSSPGPVLFAHRREQRGERGDFPCLKFRTMVNDAHQQQREMYRLNQVDGPQFKLDSDPRITRLGQFLRTTNIDELPQLINVLLGHMSLVGPRPSPFRENQICVPWRRERLSVRPGITGLWQLCRTGRHSGDFHQWIYYDMAYVRHFSLWLDLKILVLTVLTLGGRRRVALSRFIAIKQGRIDNTECLVSTA
ncbi:MAG: sugar transferase [Phycisphaerae bacterium]|nr:sugar transferase [Phycisphaerae bacterium]